MATKYCMIPMANGPFEHVDLTARAAFGLIYDRWLLSRRTNEGAERPKFAVRRYVRLGDVIKRRANDNTVMPMLFDYCIYTQDELAHDLGVSERTVRRCIDDLCRAEVIQAERTGLRGANRYIIPSEVYRYFNPPRKP